VDSPEFRIPPLDSYATIIILNRTQNELRVARTTAPTMRSKRNRLAVSSSELFAPPSSPPYKNTQSSKSLGFSTTETTSRKDARNAMEQPMKDSDQDLPEFPSDLSTAPTSLQKFAKIMTRGGEEDAPDSGSDLSSVPSSPLQPTGEKDQRVNPRTWKENPYKNAHMRKHQRNLNLFGN
jgi:hypothetical protein